MALLQGPFWIRRPSRHQLETLLESQSRQALTYPGRGATRSQAPPGYTVEHFERRLGAGPGGFARAASALGTWAPQRGAGIELTPNRPEIAQDATIVMLIPLGGGWVTAAARIVYVVSEPDRFGFAYGTLPHHPEQGEEAFVVERDGRGQVRFVIDVFSRPRHPLARLGRPVARLLQKRVTRRYLDAMAVATGA